MAVRRSHRGQPEKRSVGRMLIIENAPRKDRQKWTAATTWKMRFQN